jgi:hypothetical protein
MRTQYFNEICLPRVWDVELLRAGPAPEYSAPCAKLLWRLPPVYIVYWYICLTLNRVKVHKYFFRFEDYDGICGSTTRDTWNSQLLRLWRQRRRADARQTHMDYLWNKPRRRIFKFMIKNWRPYTLGALCRGTGCTPLEPSLAMCVALLHSLVILGLWQRLEISPSFTPSEISAGSVTTYKVANTCFENLSGWKYFRPILLSRFRGEPEDLNIWHCFEVKISISWDVMPCSSLKTNLRFEGTFHLHLQGRRITQGRNQLELFFDPEDGANVFLRNVDLLSTNHTALCSRRENSSWQPLWEPQIPHDLNCSFVQIWKLVSHYSANTRT